MAEVASAGAGPSAREAGPAPKIEVKPVAEAGPLRTSLGPTAEVVQLRKELAESRAAADALRAERDAAVAARDEATARLNHYLSGGKSNACPNGHPRDKIRAISPSLLHCSTCGIKWPGKV